MSAECPSAEISGLSMLATPSVPWRRSVTSATADWNSLELVLSSSLWIRTCSVALSSKAPFMASAAWPDSPGPAAEESISFCGIRFIPTNIETITNASHPRMAFLRCWVLQRPIRAVMLRVCCMRSFPSVVVECMDGSLLAIDPPVIGPGP